MKNKENDNPLFDNKLKIQIGLVAIGSLLFICLKVLLKAVILLGFCCLIYGLFLLGRGGAYAKTYILVGSGLIGIWILAQVLFYLFKVVKQKTKRDG